MRHLETLQGQFATQWAATTGILGAQLKESREENKQLRDEIRERAARESSLVREERMQESLAVLERAQADEHSARAEATRELASKMGIAIPVLLSKFGQHIVRKMKEPKAKPVAGAAAEPEALAPELPLKADAKLAAVLATITDAQIEQFEAAGFDSAQIDALKQARDGTDLRPIISQSETFTPPQYGSIFQILTAAQVDALTEAIPDK